VHLFSDILYVKVSRHNPKVWAEITFRKLDIIIFYIKLNYTYLVFLKYSYIRLLLVTGNVYYIFRITEFWTMFTVLHLKIEKSDVSETGLVSAKQKHPFSETLCFLLF
jgi:hypothetical protein